MDADAQGLLAADEDAALTLSGHGEISAQADRQSGLLEIYKLTDRLYRARNLEDVLEAALDAIMSTLACSEASILLFDSEGIMRFVAWRGLSSAYRETLEGHSPWTPDSIDPPPIFISDIKASDEPQDRKARIMGENIRSLGFIPLTSQGRVIGKFMAYHTQPHDFTPDERALAVTIARQLGFSIERAHMEQARYQAERGLRESEERFRIMSENAPVMLWISDQKGACLHLNRMQREFWNVPENGIETFDWRTMMHPDDIPRITSRMIEAIQKTESVSISGRYRNAKGEYRILETDARPRFAEDGRFLGMIGVNIDITDRQKAEDARRESEERFRLVVEASPCGMIMTDGNGQILMANARAERLFGYTRDELTSSSIGLLVPSSQKPGATDDDDIATTLLAGTMAGEAFGVHKSGEEFPVEISVNPIHASEGTRIIATISDISERKRAESQRELLLAELNHRVKNTLAVVQGLAYQTFRTSDAAARKAFEGRLLALATAHNLLTQSNWEGASLRKVVSDTLLPGQIGQRISVSGPDVRLSPRAALAIAMALHELLTNTIKFGSLSNDSGKVSFEWTANKEIMRLALLWKETGGPPVSPPTHRGFGSLLVHQALKQDLDAKVDVDFAPHGLTCSIDLPLSRRGGHACLG